MTGKRKVLAFVICTIIMTVYAFIFRVEPGVLYKWMVYLALGLFASNALEHIGNKPQS